MVRISYFFREKNIDKRVGGVGRAVTFQGMELSVFSRSSCFLRLQLNTTKFRSAACVQKKKFLRYNFIRRIKCAKSTKHLILEDKINLFPCRTYIKRIVAVNSWRIAIGYWCCC